MSSCKCTFLHDIDIFGKEPEFYYKGRSKRTTLVGRIFTILYFCVYVAFFIYKLVKMIQREDVTFYDTFAFTGEIPSIKLTSDNFYGGFGILGPNGEPFVEESIYYATAVFWSGVKDQDGIWKWEETKIPLERCKLEKFGQKYHDMFRDKDLDNMYCLGHVDVTLEGYATSDRYSYFEVKLFPCMGQTKDGYPCLPQEQLKLFLTKNQFMFKMQDIELTPQDYKSPVQEREKDISGPVYSTLQQQIYAYMQVTNIETDEDIVGFGLSNIKKEKFLKYDESWIISSPMYGDVYTSGNPLSVITVQLSEKALTQKRSYTTLIEVLGDVGGLMEVLLTVVNLILSFIVDNLYEKSIINNLFEFDLDKKVIILKKKQNIKKEILSDDNLQIFNEVKPMPIIPQNSLYINEDNTIQTRNKLNEDPISKNKLEEDNMLASKTSKIKKKKKKKIKIPVNLTQIDENKKTNEQNLIVHTPKIEEENCNIYNKKNEKELEPYIIKANIETEKGKTRRIIKRIKMNKFCTYLCFLCVRKRKTLENALLNEGMNIITEQLDILNIFRKMHNDEKIQEHFKDIPIEMSDACKVDIHDIINNIYKSWDK